VVALLPGYCALPGLSSPLICPSRLPASSAAMHQHMMVPSCLQLYCCIDLMEMAFCAFLSMQVVEGLQPPQE
jgi:hypothetical protein